LLQWNPWRLKRCAKRNERLGFVGRFENLESRLLLAVNPFTPGDLVVYRMGDATTPAGTSSATSVYLDEYTTAGALVQSIALPSSTASGALALTDSGKASSAGQLTLSPDSSTLGLFGYDVSAGSASATSSANETVSLVTASASPSLEKFVDETTSNARSAVYDPSTLKLFTSGGLGLFESSFSPGGTPTTSTIVSGSSGDVQIVGGIVYYTSGTSVMSLGGEPTITTTGTTVVSDGSSASPVGFTFARLGTGATYGTSGDDTLYVADTSSTHGTLFKYTWNGASWASAGSITGPDVSSGSQIIGVTVASGGNVYFTEGNTGSGTVGDVYKFTDAFATTISSGNTTPTRIVSITSNENFRGIAFAPDDGVGAISGLGGTTSYAQGLTAVNPASAAAFLDASNFDGGKLVVSGGLANDTLGVTSGANGITTSGSAVSYNGTQIGAFSGGSGTTALTITFNNVGGNPVTSAAVQALLKQIAFSSTTSSVIGNRTLSFQLTENDGATDTAATQTVTVSASAASPPSIDALGSLNINQSSSQQSVGLSGIQHNGGTGVITVTALSDNPSLIANAGQGALAVSYTSPGASGTLTFTPVAGASGTAHIKVTAMDSIGSTTATETVNVVAPPIDTVPGAQQLVENTTRVFSTTNGNAPSIADAAAGTNTVQVTLSVNHGTLTLNGTSGLTFANGANGQASFTFSGTIANINTALNGLSYAPTVGYNGSDTLQLVTNDLGHTPSGSAQSSTSSVALTVLALPSVLLNEIEANDPGADDNRYEYVELSGMPGLSLNSVYFVVFDGSAGSVGTADLVVNLSGYSLGSDGLLVIQSSASTGHTIPAATTLVADSTFFTQSGGFRNGSMSFFLYDSPNAAFAAGTRYDTNRDGTLDHLPTGAAAIDNVAILNTNNIGSDIIYGGVDVIEQATQNLGTADAVTRFPGNSSTTSAAWYGGELYDIGNVDSTIDYDATRQSANEPMGAYLTPGAVNYPQPPVVTGVYASGTLWGSGFYGALDVNGLGDPTVANQGFLLFDGAAQLTSDLPWTSIDTISVAFSENVNVSQTGLTLYDSSNNATSPTSFSYDATNFIAHWTFSNPLAANIWWIGLAASTVTDPSGVELDGDWTTGVSTFAQGSGDGTPGGDFNYLFNVLTGDVNNNGTVSTGDVLQVKTQLNAALDGTNYRQDINANATIATGDVLQAKTHLNTSLSQFPSPTLPTSAAPASLVTVPASASAADSSTPDSASTSLNGVVIAPTVASVPNTPAMSQAAASNAVAPASSTVIRPEALSTHNAVQDLPVEHRSVLVMQTNPIAHAAPSGKLMTSGPNLLGVNVVDPWFKTQPAQQPSTGSKEAATPNENLALALIGLDAALTALPRMSVTPRLPILFLEPRSNVGDTGASPDVESWRPRLATWIADDWDAAIRRWFAAESVDAAARFIFARTP
jgi:hypothetical protein